MQKQRIAINNWKLVQRNDGLSFCSIVEELETVCGDDTNCYILDKLFKNGPCKICGREPLKKLKG